MITAREPSGYTSGRQYCGPEGSDRPAFTLESGMLPPVRLLLLQVPAELGSRNQRKSGRRVTRLPAAMPRLASTLDQMEMLAVASVGRNAVSIYFWACLLPLASCVGG